LALLGRCYTDEIGKIVDLDRERSKWLKLLLTQQSAPNSVKAHHVATVVPETFQLLFMVTARHHNTSHFHYAN
jgi:hypothetical protein